MAQRRGRSPGETGPTHVWRLAIGFGVGSALVLGALAVWAARASSGPAMARTPDTVAHGVPHVAIVGDSITEQGEAVLNEVLGSRWPLEIDGRSGYTIVEQQPAATALADRDPTQVIVNLGTNDVWHGGDLTTSASDLATLVATFAGATCIHLVTINESMVPNGISLGARAAEVNQAIRDLAARDPRIHLIDWSAAVAADQSGPQPYGPIVGDSIHPTKRGQLVLAQLYADSLAACPVRAAS